MIHIQSKELHHLIKVKLKRAGLSPDHAQEVANHLVFADLRGVHSHGAIRVEYYAERITKGGITTNPNFHFEKTSTSTGIYHGDNGSGHVAANEAMKKAILLAKETGVGIVGVRKISHSGVLSYFVKKAALEDLVALSVCQSDPMVVPFGGSKPYFGTNPIAFAAPIAGNHPIVFDMATTVQAWGKVLEPRSKGQEIPDTWAVDREGNPTTDPYQVNALLPIAGSKGYGLMMMVDILAGTLLGLPFGQHVSSMYTDLTKGRDLGQLHLVINPSCFTDVNLLKTNLSKMIAELHENNPAKGFNQVLYPGERAETTEKRYKKEGIPIIKEIYDYLISDNIHFNRYDQGNAFAKRDSQG